MPNWNWKHILNPGIGRTSSIRESEPCKLESAPAPGKRLDSNTDPLLSEMTRYLWLQLREKYVDSNGSGSAYRCSEPHSRVETLKYNCHPSREFDIGMGIGYWISAAERRIFLADEAFYAVLFLQFSMCYQAFRLVVPGPNFGVFNARLKMPRTHPKLYL